MKLAKITDEVIGLVVTLSDGPHIVDIAKSVGVFVPYDPLSNGLLNGRFKDGGDCPLGPTVCKTARPPQRLFRLVFESHTGRALVPIPKRSTSPRATSTPG
jgi:hypothetical protein